MGMPELNANEIYVDFLRLRKELEGFFGWGCLSLTQTRFTLISYG
jgi:hypothetical protein